MLCKLKELILKVKCFKFHKKFEYTVKEYL